MAARCGPLTEAAKRFTAAQGLLPDPPRGVVALTGLLQAIDHHPDTTEPDEAFLEQAGAFLALVVAEQLGEACHVSDGGRHGLQLGSFGYFDPFGTLEDVMASGDRGRALVQAIAAAEAEASGRGQMASLVARLHRQLASQGLPVDTLRRFEDRVFLDDMAQGVEVDLSRLALATRDEPGAQADAAVARLAHALAQSATPAPPLCPEERARVLPRLVGPAFVSRLPERDGPARLLLRPLADDLWAALVVQYRGRARYVRVGEADAALGGSEAAMALALDNLATRSEAVRIARAETDAGAIVVLRSGDGLDASRLLCPAVRSTLCQALGGPVRVGVPHRDLLLACAADATETVAALGHKVTTEAARAPHAISARLLELDAAGDWAIAAPCPPSR